MDLYKNLIRPLLFQWDSETIHEIALARCESPSIVAMMRALIRAPQDTSLAATVAGIRFPNVIGLAAGFDKDCRAFPFFQALGFGCVEVGTVTSKAQEGNPKPRIFRLVPEEALINRMGFPSKGVDAILENLSRAYRSRGATVLGVNIGKHKLASIEDAAEDYTHTFQKVAPYADYVAINVSSPNTPDLRKLQEPERLTKLFSSLRAVNVHNRPLFVKIAPDLTDDELRQVVSVCIESEIAAIIATNTTLARPHDTGRFNEVGGLSGRPLFDISYARVSSLANLVRGKIPIIAVGGIRCAEQVTQMMRAGASLVQVYTGLVYEGPWMVSSILRELIQRGEMPHPSRK